MPADNREPMEESNAPARSPARFPFGGGFRLARVFGIEIQLDWSLLLIFTLVLFNLGAGLLPKWHPDWSPVLTWGTALAAAVLFFASILAHELSHSLVARVNGIPVSRITLFLFGGLAHMEREPPSPRSEFLMAAVGPVTSLVIGFVASAAGAALAGPGFAESLREDPAAAMRALGALPSLLLWLGPINILLGVFNLVPGFPLDGGRVLRSIIWWIKGDLKTATLWASGVGRAFAWALMAWGVVHLLGGGFLQGVWLILIGWFLNNAANMSVQQLVLQEGLRGVPVSRLMFTRFSTVRPDTSVEALVREEIMGGDQRAFPVASGDGGLAGLVTLEDVRKVSRDAWGETTVADIMTPADRLATLPPEALSERALEVLRTRDVEQVPVVEKGRVMGLVRRRDLLKWLSLHLGKGGVES